MKYHILYRKKKKDDTNKKLISEIIKITCRYFMNTHTNMYFFLKKEKIFSLYPPTNIWPFSKKWKRSRQQNKLSILFTVDVRIEEMWWQNRIFDNLFFANKKKGSVF